VQRKTIEVILEKKKTVPHFDSSTRASRTVASTSKNSPFLHLIYFGDIYRIFLTASHIRAICKFITEIYYIINYYDSYFKVKM